MQLWAESLKHNERASNFFEGSSAHSSAMERDTIPYRHVCGQVKQMNSMEIVTSVGAMVAICPFMATLEFNGHCDST